MEEAEPRGPNLSPQASQPPVLPSVSFPGLLSVGGEKEF